MLIFSFLWILFHADTMLIVFDIFDIVHTHYGDSFDTGYLKAKVSFWKDAALTSCLHQVINILSRANLKVLKNQIISRSKILLWATCHYFLESSLLRDFYVKISVWNIFLITMSPYYFLPFFFQFGISSKKGDLTFSVQYITYMSVMYVHMTLSLSKFFSIYIKATGTVPPAFQTHYSSKMENIFL